jgi:photosystem II stability/assembly factor-like uncharacterized protein
LHRTEVIVDTLVAVGEPGLAFVEPFVAADPTDANRLIITVSQIDPAHGIRGRVFVSSDGGRHWNASELPGLRAALDTGRLTSVLDMWAAVGERGTMYVSALASHARNASRATDPWSSQPTFLFRSADHGAHWVGPTVIRSTTSDAAKITVWRDTVVILATEIGAGDAVAHAPPTGSEHIAVYRSDDGGRSFLAPSFLVFDNLGHNPLNPVVLADGTVLAGWFDHPHFGRSGGEQHVSGSRIFVARSGDGGRTFEIPRVVGDVQRVGFPAVLRMVVDDGRNSAHYGRTYIIWNGGIDTKSNVALSYSDDGGRSWSRAIAVTSGDGNDVFTAAAVNPDGVVGLLWAHHERDVQSTPCYVMRFVASGDGASTFGVPVQLAGKPICPSAPENRGIRYPAYGGRTDTVATTWPHGGHYIGLAASTDGVFHPVWTDTRDGPYRAYTTRIQVRSPEK